MHAFKVRKSREPKIIFVFYLLMITHREGVRVIYGINNSQIQTCDSPCPLTPSFPKLFRRRFAGVIKVSTHSLALNPGASKRHYSTADIQTLSKLNNSKECLHDLLKQQPPFPLTSQTVIQNTGPASHFRFTPPPPPSSFSLLAVGKLTYNAFLPPTEMECGATMRSIVIHKKNKKK